VQVVLAPRALLAPRAQLSTRARFWVETIALVSVIACALALAIAIIGALAGAAAGEAKAGQSHSLKFASRDVFPMARASVREIPRSA
jgi:hypothetical protein